MLLDQHTLRSPSPIRDPPVQTPSQQVEVHRPNINQLQIIQTFEKTRNDQKYFLVKPSFLNQEHHQSSQSLYQMQIPQGDLSFGQLQNQDFELGKVKVAKVFDNSIKTCYYTIQKEIALREKFVGDSVSFLPCYGYTVHDQEMFFIDSKSQLHYYKEGYTIALFKYCENGDLLNFILNKHSYDSDKYLTLTKNIFKSLCYAIQDIHTKGKTCLLNLSCEKVLLDSNLNPYLYDFSMSQSLEKNLITSDLKKQINDSLKKYQAPEILSDSLIQPLNGTAIDIFSLGVILFIMLFEQQPFGKATQEDGLYRYLTSQDEKVQDKFFKFHPKTKNITLPENLKKLIKGMLHYDPTKRLSLDNILSDEWINQE